MSRRWAGPEKRFTYISLFWCSGIGWNQPPIPIYWESSEISDNHRFPIPEIDQNELWNFGDLRSFFGKTLRYVEFSRNSGEISSRYRRHRFIVLSDKSLKKSKSFGWRLKIFWDLRYEICQIVWNRKISWCAFKWAVYRIESLDSILVGPRTSLPKFLKLWGPFQPLQGRISFVLLTTLNALSSVRSFWPSEHVQSQRSRETTSFSLLSACASRCRDQLNMCRLREHHNRSTAESTDATALRVNSA